MCKVIAITNRKLCYGDFLNQIRLLAKAGVDQLVLREKDLTKIEYEELAKDVLSICEEYAITCVLHKYIEVAKKLGMPRIHLSVPDTIEHKKELQSFSYLGVSTHSLEQLKIAQEYHADYVFYGHVFPTDCKKGVPARGVENLKSICESAIIPVYAIGGITPENAGQATAAGASGVCVMSWGMQAGEEKIREFVTKCHMEKW